MAKSFFDRYSKAVLLAVLVATPIIFVGAIRAVRSNVNKVEDWLPDSFPETHDLEWYRKYFVGDQFVLLSWEGCELGDPPGTPNGRSDDPRLERLARHLVPLSGDPETAASRSGYFKSATTGRRLLNELTSDPLNVPHDEALERLSGWLIGPHGKQTGLLITLSDEGVEHMRKAIGLGRRGPFGVVRNEGVLIRAIREVGLDPNEVHFGGPPVDNVAIDEEGEKTLVKLAGMSGLLGLALSWFSLRSWKLTLIVFAAGILSAAISLALVYATGETMDAVMMSMPALVYVLAVSGAVHLIHYYREEVIENGQDGAPSRALRLGWKPTLLCNVTTSLGLLSLHVSDLVPIRKFGDYSALGVVAMILVLFIYLPAALVVWPWHPPKHQRTPQPKPAVEREKESGRHDSHFFAIDRYWMMIANFIVRNHVLVAAGCVAVVVGVGYGVTKIKTSIQLLELFDSEARVLADYRWIEKHLGRIVPMELIVKFKPEAQEPAQAAAPGENDRHATIAASEEIGKQSFLERLEIVDLIQQMVGAEFGAEGRDVLGRSMSTATFAPRIPPMSSDIRTIARRKGVNGRLEASREEYDRLGYLKKEPDGTELWRISLRVAAFQDVDYGQFMHELQGVVEPVLDAHEARLQVLRELIASRPDGGYAGAEVQVIGHAYERKSSADSNRDRPAVFMDSLALLLDGRGLRVSLDDAPVPASELTDAEGRVQKIDCTVIAGPVSADEERVIRDTSTTVVDLRGVSQRLHELDVKGEFPAVGHINQQDPRLVAVTYTGVVPIVYKAQRMLLDNLMESAAGSFLSITPVLMFVTWSISAGMVAMLPNVLPILVIFGGMGWLGVKVDIGSMMSASIALGVAVDDTIHFLAWFRRDLDELRNRRLAILSAYKRCATPTLQAALISGLGLSVFAISSFMPTQRFGVLMLAILCAGVVAELIMFPALLAGPLGKVFRPRVPAPSVENEGTAEEPRRQQRRARKDGPHFEAVASAPPADLRVDSRGREAS